MPRYAIWVSKEKPKKEAVLAICYGATFAEAWNKHSLGSSLFRLDEDDDCSVEDLQKEIDDSILSKLGVRIQSVIVEELDA